MEQTTGSIQVAQKVPCTEAEGPGSRFALWVQGCPMRCPQCCNPEMLSFKGGTAQTTQSLLAEIVAAQTSRNIEGITLIGGEPFAHAKELASLASAVREHQLSVMVFSGYTLHEIQTMNDGGMNEFLSQIDLLVDGRYESGQPDSQRRWIGSSNQAVHFLTDRYSAADAFWGQSDTLEIRMEGGDILVNGFPASSAGALWKRRP